MASKFGLAGGIPERRVRPIWDAIDSRQFKNALKQSASLLSKYPNSPYALALKALILERMGKNEEALSVCLNAKGILLSYDSSNVIDDLTLSTLQIVFQRLDHLDMATSCYEFACGKYPNNLELMMGLFNCYVREYSFVKQQQIAIKMYKIAGEERFLIWAVCSIQLQICCGDGGEKLFTWLKKTILFIFTDIISIIYVMAQGFGNFNPRRDTAGFNLVDPPLRNTINVPVGGWAVIRFVADNPGVWLMHCHIDSLLAWGLSMAFLVENGHGELQSIEPPPPDLPPC